MEPPSLACRFLRKSSLSSYILFIWCTLILLISLSSLPSNLVLSSSSNPASSLVIGTVTDAKTSHPIAGASIVASRTVSVGTGRSVTYQTITYNTETETNGNYRLEVDGGFSYQFYVYSDELGTPGYDYVPKLQSILVESGKETISDFSLIEAASIILSGDLILVNSSLPLSTWTLTVFPREVFSDYDGNIITYGPSASSVNGILHINSSHIIVPTQVAFEIIAATPNKGSITIDDPSFSNLAKGEAFRIEIAKYTFQSNLGIANTLLKTSEELISKADQDEFYVLADRRDLETASLLIQDSQTEYSRGYYVASYTDLREAYVQIVSIVDDIQSMYAGASLSVPILILFVAATSIAISYLLFENLARKIIASGLFFSALITVFYNVYGGCRVVGLQYVSGLSVLMFSAALVVSLFLAHFFPMTIVFSLAKRNIRRRRTRFFLTLVPITVLVMSFVALTSFSSQDTFALSAIGTSQSGAQGILVREIAPEIPSFQGIVPYGVATFKHIDESVMDWLLAKSDIVAVTPKVENEPNLNPEWSVSTSYGSIMIYGILGVLPSAEAQILGLNKTIAEGRYLNDNETDAILISSAAAESMDLHVGDDLALSGRTMRLVGIFDDELITQLHDFDGQSILPEKIVKSTSSEISFLAPPSWSLTRCDPSEVVIANWKTAMQLSITVLISRVDVKAEASTDLLQLARTISLERDYNVWVDSAGKITFVGETQFLEVEGTTIVIPWLIVVLDVIIVMANTIYERRKEVATLTSIGLNPTQVSLLFGAEAVVIGIIGGGIGYLTGLSSYRFMAILGAGIDVRQKISFQWCLASIGISMSAVLIGTFVALRSSVAITPSSLLRWSRGEKSKGTSTTLEFQMPVRLLEEGVSSLFSYLKHNVSQYIQSTQPRLDIEFIKDRIYEDEKQVASTYVRRIVFNYFLGRSDPMFYSPFSLVAEKKEGEETYSVKLVCSNLEEETVERRVTFIRMLIVSWEAEKN